MSTNKLVQNTNLSKKLKDIFDRRLKRKQEARSAKNKEQKKAAKRKQETSDHMDADAPLQGILGKGDNYANQAFVYIKSKDGRSVYKNFSFPHLDEIRELVRERAEFPGGPKQNFNPAFKQQFPYDWEAHHLLPGSAFYYEIDRKPAFTFQQLRLILQTEYNINHGHNLIFLPGQDWACPVHTLLCHPSDHPKWTEQILRVFQGISQELQKKIDNLAPHETLKTDVFEQLKDAEDEAWDYIVKLSRIAIPNVLRGEHLVNHELLKYETEDKQYAFPALG